jgi:photosystem II stability/assembly factor-like uncharacterized protein
MEDGLNNENEGQQVVYAVTASPYFEKNGICFAARETGLVRSEDGGETWHSAYDSLQLVSPLPTTCVVCPVKHFPQNGSSSSDEIVFAGTNGGVLRSLDNGRNWTAAILRTPSPLVTALAISPTYAQDQTIFAATVEDGVFRSIDQGAEWAAWNFGLYDKNIFCLAASPNFANDHVVYAGTESGVFRSKNGAHSWQETNFSADFAPVLSLALSPMNEDVALGDGLIFVGTESCGVFCSGDKGKTWDCLLEVDEPVNGIILSPDFPAKPHILISLGDKLMVSRDKGKSWKSWQTGLVFEDGLASMAAPLGLDEGSPLLVGLGDGRVAKIL